MHHVFISYSSKDLDITQQVRQILETNGISCWIAPRDIPVASSYAREIPAAIRGCTVFLLIASLHAEQSPWIRKELERAIIERKKIIPLMVEDVAFQDEFDFLLSLHQRYAAYEKTAETMEKLVKDIRALLGMSPSPAQMPATEPAKTVSQTETNSLRFDGFYMTAPTKGFRTYYRFFPNGAMVFSHTSATPTKAKQWLNIDKYEGGRYTINGTEIRIMKPLSGGNTYDAKVTFTSDGITLQGFNSFSKRDVTETCSFLAFDDIT